MIKKSMILGVAVSSVFMLVACGNAAGTQQNNDVSENGVEKITIGETGNVTEANEDSADGTSFGLQDFEGFYCMTRTEEMDGFEISVTEGYQFNGDGTGVCYGQDLVDITWNETEIHFADSTVPFTMEPGKLTVNDIEYGKIEGKLITPFPINVDIDNIENGIYFVDIDASGISEADGQVTIKTEIYTEDSYDIVDINQMSEGDVIYVQGQLMPVNSVEKTASGILEVNGGIENMGSAFRALDESNCFVFAGMDMDRSYTRHGVTSFKVSDNVKFMDHYDPTEEKVYTGTDAVSAIKEACEKTYLNCYNCSIMVENGEIIEVKRIYTP